MGGGVLVLILLLAVVLVVVVVIQRATDRTDRNDSGGEDIIAYLVLALAMGVAGFALRQLASTAFPGNTFVFDPAEQVATSLAALVVSVPFLIFFWRRQARRRVAFPEAAGWTLYLSLMELVFTIAFVVAAVRFITGLLDDGNTSSWTGVVVFGAIAVFHEVQARATPPRSEAGDLRRVLGSAIGLVTATIGLVGTLAGLLAIPLEATGITLSDTGFHPWIAMLIVGAPIWWYRWWRPWDSEASILRIIWTVVVTTAAMAVTVGAATSVVAMLTRALFGDNTPFTNLHVAVALLVAGLPIWLVHRRLLDSAPRGALLIYLYALAIAGLGVSVGMASTLTIAAFSERLIVGGGRDDVATYAAILIAGLATWLLFDRRASAIEAETPKALSWPRRIYTLGAGVVFALIAAGSLITVIFILLRNLLAGSETGSLLQPGSIFFFSGLAALYLLRSYARARDSAPPTEVIAPFQVTLICSHPGSIATVFPGQARLRVLHRGDDVGDVSDEMADEIVAAVGNRPSYVWVDEDGFRVAPMRVAD